jgi:adenylate cyclase
MWNAPNDHIDHADRACSAALGMLQSLPAVNDDWIIVTQRELRIGIGVHTGLVQLGNAGSSRQVKYGPRGPSVHLASRVEVATKELLVPFVATQSTVLQLSERFTANRICRATLPGLTQTVELYSIRPTTTNDRLQTAWQAYDEALCQFEQGEYQRALDTLDSIDAKLADVPLTFLYERVQCELGRQQRRRSTDKPAPCPGGVIPLSAK